MNVKELIENLKQFEPDAVVSVLEKEPGGFTVAKEMCLIVKDQYVPTVNYGRQICELVPGKAGGKKNQGVIDIMAYHGLDNEKGYGNR